MSTRGYDATSITDIGLIMRELLPAVDLAEQIRALKLPAPVVEPGPWIDVPRLGLQLRMLHVHELEPTGMTFAPDPNLGPP